VIDAPKQHHIGMARVKLPALLAFTLCAIFSSTTATPAPALAPLYIPDVPAHKLINNSYIVVFKDGVSRDVFDNHINFVKAAHIASPVFGANGGLSYVYDDPMMGYAGKFSDEVLQMIRALPEVDYVDHDQAIEAPTAFEGAQDGAYDELVDGDDGDEKDFDEEVLPDFEDVDDGYDDEEQPEIEDSEEFDYDEDTKEHSAGKYTACSRSSKEGFEVDDQGFGNRNVSADAVQRQATWVCSIIDA
jgi:hypothetical protein